MISTHMIGRAEPTTPLLMISHIGRQLCNTGELQSLSVLRVTQRCRPASTAGQSVSQLSPAGRPSAQRGVSSARDLCASRYRQRGSSEAQQRVHRHHWLLPRNSSLALLRSSSQLSVPPALSFRSQVSLRFEGFRSCSAVISYRTALNASEAETPDTHDPRY